MTAKKEGLKKTWALVVVKVIRTSRGEQLMRWRGGEATKNASAAF
jgi:hypothetical protein